MALPPGAATRATDATAMKITRPRIRIGAVSRFGDRVAQGLGKPEILAP